VNGVVNRRLLEQVLDVHEMLVAGAAHLAVERGSPGDHRRARELLRRLVQPGVSDAEQQGLFDALVDVITEASGNLVVRLVRNVIRPALAERMLELQRRQTAEPPDLYARVREIDNAIAAGNAPATEAAVRALLRERRERMLRALDALESERAPGPAQPPGAATGSA
jgi:DNA-binding FadR family transcriptional regulator